MLRPRGPPGGPMEASPASDATDAGGAGGGSDKGGAAAAGPGADAALTGTPPCRCRWRVAEEAVAAVTRFPGNTRPVAIGLAVGVLISDEDALFIPDAPPERHQFTVASPHTFPKYFPELFVVNLVSSERQSLSCKG